MANNKKNVQEEKIGAVEKQPDIKAETAAAEPAAKVENVPAAKSEAPVKTEKNESAKKDAPKTEKKRGRKPAAKTEKTDAKAEKTPAAGSGKTKTVKTDKPAADTAASASTAKGKASAAKKDDAPKTGKKRGRKPAAAKSETKTQTKTTSKRTSKKTEEKAPAKRGRKKSLTYTAVVEAARKKAAEADISRIKYPIAVNFELKGSDSAAGVFYIVVSDGKVTVEPYKYNDYDVYIEADAAEFMNVLNGKKNIYDALADGSITFRNCNLKKTILFINAVL